MMRCLQRRFHLSWIESVPRRVSGREASPRDAPTYLSRSLAVGLLAVCITLNTLIGKITEQPSRSYRPEVSIPNGYMKGARALLS